MCSFFTDLRDLCSWHLLQTPTRLGGPGAVVQIDESLFARAKYTRVHALHCPQVWIFGIYNPEKQEGYLSLVDARDGDTLCPIIEEVVLPGSVHDLQ